MQRKGRLPGKICALCIPERRFAALFGYMAREYCQSQLVLNAWRRYLAKKGRFSRPRSLRGCMKRKTCRGLPLGNASHVNIATDGRPRTHHGEILPPSDVGRGSSRAFCHRRALGDASRRNIAAASRSRAHFAKILPWANARIRLAANNDRSPAKQRQRQDPGNAPRDKRRRAFCSPSFAV